MTVEEVRGGGVEWGERVRHLLVLVKEVGECTRDEASVLVPLNSSRDGKGFARPSLRKSDTE